MDTQKDVEQLKNLLESQKQEFLSVMSHELRTPMTGVKGYLSMVLEGDAGPISPEVREFVAQAYVANDRLIRLVEHMMKVAKIQEGKIGLNIGKVDLKKEITLIVSDFQIPAKDKKQTLTYEKPDGDILIKGDPDRVREIIMNLVSNAIKFTPEGGNIVISQKTDNDSVTTIVTDNGIGIPKKFQAKLFEVFSKANLTLTGQEKGTGVGLYLAGRLAEAQNGKVWLESSEPGKGSVFCFSIPKYK